MAKKRSRRKTTFSRPSKRSRIKKITEKPEEIVETEMDAFSKIPMDLKVDILMRHSAKTIAKCGFVSTHWSKSVRSKEITDLYLNRSLTRPRFLFRVTITDLRFFHSCSQTDPSRDIQRVRIDSDHNYIYSPPVRGLICGSYQKNVLVGNPSTGQFLALPNPTTDRKGTVSFFGYDPVGNEYKVLCMTVKNCYHTRGKALAEEHQVFTLGAKQTWKWRMIKCKHPHLPLAPLTSKGVCLNGKVYYYASIKLDGYVMSFDVSSEDFDVIELPKDVRNLKEFCSLVNYGGKIAVTYVSCDGKLDLRVLEDAAEQVWSKVSVVVPSWRELVGYGRFYFEGALSTGELIFSPRSCIGTFDLIFYDPNENTARKEVVMEGLGDYYRYVQVFFDHLESPLFLSNKSNKCKLTSDD